jgi:putative Mg2+ transporter-C (MgtC) family protein
MATLPYSETLLRLVIAAVLGSLIGLERERLAWAAGMRTHMLVCVGACLFMIVSTYGFSTGLGQNVVLDPSRVAAQVVSGIGFLGAGAILARGEIVKGLTTAASIWTVAAIGLAVGGGLYFAAASSTVIILAILAGVKPLEAAYRARAQSCRVVAEAQRGALTPESVKRALGLRMAQIKRFVVTTSNDLEKVTIVLGRVPSQATGGIVDKINNLPGVIRASIVAQSNDRAMLDAE